MYLLQKRLKHIKLRLKEWNKLEFGNIFEAKKMVEKKCRSSTKTSSWRVLIKIKMSRQLYIIENGKAYVKKRKYSGGKNLEFSG